MTACDMNIVVASLSNYLYECLPEDDFECLALLLSELSKSMFTMSIYERMCGRDRQKPHNKQAVKLAEGEDTENAELLEAANLLAGQ